MQKKIILVGAGHAHLAVLDQWRRSPLPDHQLLLINNHKSQIFAGMLPGYLGGRYRHEEVCFDLPALCERSGAVFVERDISQIDPHRQNVIAADDSWDFHICSIAVGSEPVWTHSLFGFKPIHRFLSLWEKVRAETNPQIAVIGGGVDGVEMAAMMKAVLGARAQVVVYDKKSKPLSDYGDKAGQIVLEYFKSNGIKFVGQSSARFFNEKFVFQAAGAVPPQILLRSPFHKDDRGFLRVTKNLNMETFPQIFASGDCARIAPNGATLAHNIWASANGKSLREYSPAPSGMKLISLGPSNCLLIKGSHVFQSRFFWKLKDYFDRPYKN